MELVVGDGQDVRGDLDLLAAGQSDLEGREGKCGWMGESFGTICMHGHVNNRILGLLDQVRPTYVFRSTPYVDLHRRVMTTRNDT